IGILEEGAASANGKILQDNRAFKLRAVTGIDYLTGDEGIGGELIGGRKITGGVKTAGIEGVDHDAEAVGAANDAGRVRHSGGEAGGVLQIGAEAGRDEEQDSLARHGCEAAEDFREMSVEDGTEVSGGSEGGGGNRGPIGGLRRGSASRGLQKGVGEDSGDGLVEQLRVRGEFLGGALAGGAINGDAVAGEEALQEFGSGGANSCGVIVGEVDIVEGQSHEALGDGNLGIFGRGRGGRLGFQGGSGPLVAGLWSLDIETRDGVEFALIVNLKILAVEILAGLGGVSANDHANLHQIDGKLEGGLGIVHGDFGLGVGGGGLRGGGGNLGRGRQGEVPRKGSRERSSAKGMERMGAGATANAELADDRSW